MAWEMRSTPDRLIPCVLVTPGLELTAAPVRSSTRTVPGAAPERDGVDDDGQIGAVPASQQVERVDDGTDVVRGGGLLDGASGHRGADPVVAPVLAPYARHDDARAGSGLVSGSDGPRPVSAPPVVTHDGTTVTSRK